MTQIKTPHKHAEAIHAFADGAEIQYQNDSDELWRDIKNPPFLYHINYRVKIAPVMAWFRVGENKYGGLLIVCAESAESHFQQCPEFSRWLTDRIEYEVTQ